MKKSTFVFFSALFFSSRLFSQDVRFSQPYSSPLNLNPAFAGSSGCARTIVGYHVDQWPEFPGAPRTFFASYDQYLKPLRGGVGLNYYNDRMGNFIFNRVDAIYSAHIPFFQGRYVFKPAVELSFMSNNVAFNWTSPSGSTAPVIMSNNFLDVSFGALWYSKRIFMGTVLHHISEPDHGFYGTSPLPMKFTFHGGVNIGKVDAEKAFIVTPSLLFSRQEQFREMIPGCKVRYDKCSAGIAYSNFDALIVSVGLEYARLKIGYSYDINVSGLRSASMGSSHEIVLGFAFNCKNNVTEKLFLYDMPF